MAINRCVSKGTHALSYFLSRLVFIMCLGFVSVLVGCGSQPTRNASFNSAPQRIDFSGNWEKNYQRSDDVNSKFRLFVFDVQRSMNSNASQGPRSIPGGSNEALVGLARITEDITKITLLEVNQDKNGIFIDREDSFALICNYYRQAFVVSENPFGSEVCGWNGDQLIFQINLLDGLSIHHQVTLSQNRLELNITTTVRSSSVASPFTVSNFYQRYTPAVDDFDCVFTLSRNNVCRQSD